MEHEDRPLKRKERRELERRDRAPRYSIESAAQALKRVGFDVENGAKHQKFSHPVTNAKIGLPYHKSYTTLSDGICKQVHELVVAHQQYSSKGLRDGRERD